MIRRVILGALTASLLVPAATQAATMRPYSSKALGVSFRYPASWRLTTQPEAGARSIMVSSSGAQYSLSVLTYGLKPGKTLAATLRRYVTFTRQIDGPVVAQYHWTRTSFAGRAAEGTVTYPPTEGGVSTAIGIYVVGVHKHIYGIRIVMRGRTLPKSLGTFPNVYRTIFSTWKFL
jgi:hypothetical protein